MYSVDNFYKHYIWIARMVFFWRSPEKEFHSGDRAHQKTPQSFYPVSNFSLLILKWANGESK
ncbi:MAG: hypothetical protein QNJ41_13970 [Xenococcaceae cyanobacterium MO_188.B32]|nr:hypothetical protein [Xenococcaceae cyanobacterium MO_188.B32]